MRFDLIAPAPEVFAGWRQASILGRAQESGALTLVVHALRDWADDRHGTLDDVPYGGGAGMVLKPEPLARAIAAVRALADQHRLSDPRFANDLYAAADRHELLHDAAASALQCQQPASAVDYS